MKRKSINRALSVLIILVFGASAVSAQVRGSGSVVKQEREVGDFHGVVVKSGIDLTVKQGSQPALVIETDDNLQEYIISEVKEGILYVYVRKNSQITRSNAMDAHVTVKDLEKISASGGGDVESLTMINTGEISIDLSGGGDLSFKLTANRALCELSGGGNASLEGSIREYKASLSGGGDLDLEGEIGMIDIELSGGGDAMISTEGKTSGIVADMSGGGNLNMETDCENLKISSGGGGNVTLEAGENVENAGIKMVGGGDLIMKIRVTECMISVGGGGDAALSGSAEKFYAEMKSGGDLSADEFKVQAAKITLTGGSDARIYVEQELKLDGSGGSDVYLSGDPHIDANLTGGSKLHRK